jgi:hypothetical protein
MKEHQKRFCSRTRNDKKMEKSVGRNGMNKLRRDRLAYVIKKNRRL